MKSTSRFLAAALAIILLSALTACSNSSGDDNTSIVGTWRTNYSDGIYNMSISYTFKGNGEYLSSTSYRGNGVPDMQLETKGKYSFSGTSLQMTELEYSVYTEDGGGSTGKNYGGEPTSSFPATISGNTLTLSKFTLSALYIGDITFKRD